MSIVPRKRWAFGPGLVLAPLLLAFALVACGDSDDPTPTPTTAPTEEPLTVTDSDGVELQFEEAPTRIVSFSPAATEILFAIGAGDRVIAADEFSDFPAETADLPKVSYSEPDPENVLSFDPDLVIVATRQQESVEQLRGLGLVVFLNRAADSVDGVLENITLLGEVTGQSDEAEALVTSMQERIDAVESAIADVEAGPSVFYELSDSLFTVAPDTFIGSYLTLLKASNVAEGAESQFPQLTAEAVIEANPEVILLADGEFDGGRPEDVAARPGWDVIDAVASDRLYPVDPDIGNRPGPRIVEAIEEVAALLYPELFE